MKYLFLLSFVFLLSACSWFQEERDAAKDAVKNTWEEGMQTGKDTIEKGKQVATDIKETAEKTRDDIKNTINDVEKTLEEIKEAKEALDTLFGGEAPKDITACEQDADCAIVSYLGCCSRHLAINSEFEEQYKKESDWQSDDVSLCSEKECVDIARLQQSPTVAQCAENTCVLLYSEGGR